MSPQLDDNTSLLQHKVYIMLTHFLIFRHVKKTNLQDVKTYYLKVFEYAEQVWKYIQMFWRALKQLMDCYERKPVYYTLHK